MLQKIELMRILLGKLCVDDAEISGDVYEQQHFWFLFSSHSAKYYIIRLVLFFAIPYFLTATAEKNSKFLIDRIVSSLMRICLMDVEYVNTGKYPVVRIAIWRDIYVT